MVIQCEKIQDKWELTTVIDSFIFRRQYKAVRGAALKQFKADCESEKIRLNKILGA